MAELKTKKTSESVADFIARVEDPNTRRDCATITAIMEDVTKEKAAMWGTSIVGFGTYHYKYASGQEGDWPLVGFSPRKKSLTLYIMPGFEGYQELLGKLGKHTKGQSCLYVKSLDDIHLPTLKTLVRQSVKQMKQIVKERTKQA
jgi:uncharacterized protein DUF1801